VSIEELTQLALAADPEAPLPSSAVPFGQVVDAQDALLPQWYMPSPMSGVHRARGWTSGVAILLILSFVLITAYGLCNTYGSLANP